MVVTSLYEFKYEKIKPHEHVVFIIGKHGSGKTNLYKDLMYHHRNRVDVVIVFCRSENLHNSYKNMCVPLKYIFSTFDAVLLKKLWDWVSMYKLRAQFVFDDMAFGGKNMFKDETLQNFFFMARHAQVGVAFLVHFATHIPHDMRKEYDVAIVMGNTDKQVQQSLKLQFFGIYDEYKNFREDFQHFTLDYGAMVVINYKPNYEIRKTVFYKKASIRAPFAIGCKAYRDNYKKWQKRLIADGKDSNKQLDAVIRQRQREVDRNLRRQP